jgi:hypothetical protein
VRGQNQNKYFSNINLMKLLWLISFLIPFNLVAQNFPVDAASGKIYYAEEVLVKDGPKSDLYNRAKRWFASAGKSKKALKIDDPANGILVGRQYSLLSVYNGGKNQNFMLWYTVKLELEDDRYWYSISDLGLQKAHLPKEVVSEANQKSVLPLETLVLSKDAVDLKGREKPLNNSIKEAAHKSILALIKDIKANML